MDEIVVRRVSEFIAYIEEHCSKPDIYLFRGQCQDWPLLPKIARIKPVFDLLETERVMFENFKRKSIPFLEIRPDGDWDWLAVAQHHGLPTRLLDWSMNGLTALWFAVNEPPRDQPEGVVWVFEPRLDDQADRGLRCEIFKNETTAVVFPSFVSRRIVSQGGHFTALASRETAPHFLPLEKDEAHRGSLTKIRIPANFFYSIAYDLSRLGTNYSSIFPDLEGLCRDIAWWWTCRPDEPPFLEGQGIVRPTGFFTP
jgi:hypothetical protein